jgi:NAD-dependent SIR2 family protein deacetylase
MRRTFLVGAGISAESGIPTFREEDGFWVLGSKNKADLKPVTQLPDTLAFLQNCLRCPLKRNI